MPACTIERAEDGAYRLQVGGRPVLWSSFAEALSEQPAVRAALTETLCASEHDAFFWECRPWPAAGDPVFEYVLVPTPAFAGMRARPAAFGAHFGAELVAAFDSLGGDARLVAPRPLGRPDDALHLARFVRRAPAGQIDALWIAVGHEIEAWRRAQRGSLWLSTSGLGVPWLHVRLDARPKYYTHAPYRAECSSP